MGTVVLRLGDLRDAAAQYGRLSVPAGARGTIPRTTEIKAAPDGILVETPHLEIAVIASGAWGATVSVDCKLLHKTLDDLKKRWKDIGGENAQMSLSAGVDTLDFSWTDGNSTRRYSIPAWPPKHK